MRVRERCVVYPASAKAQKLLSSHHEPPEPLSSNNVFLQGHCGWHSDLRLQEWDLGDGLICIAAQSHAINHLFESNSYYPNLFKLVKKQALTFFTLYRFIQQLKLI